MKDYRDYKAAQAHYKTLHLPPIKIVLTGTGRVGSGAAHVLKDMGITEVAPKDFLEKQFPYPVFTHLGAAAYVARKDGGPFSRQDFYRHPDRYMSTFAPYSQVADVMVHGIFWDNRAPAFFSLDEMRQPDFHIRVIADITCDIAPEASLPSTLRPSTIADPVYGFDPSTNSELPAFSSNGTDIMAIDNLPSELPRDASESFGKKFIEHVLPELFLDHSEMLEKATIARDGLLTPHFRYLEDYVAAHSEATDPYVS